MGTCCTRRPKTSSRDSDRFEHAEWFEGTTRDETTYLTMIDSFVKVVVLRWCFTMPTVRARRGPIKVVSVQLSFRLRG